MINVKKIKRTLNTIEKKQKELATYKAKITKLEQQIKEWENAYMQLAQGIDVELPTATKKKAPQDEQTHYELDE